MTRMSPLVSANIVTGFLGSGKTTLLQSALKHGLAGRKVALIVNDLGEIGIDGVLLQGVNVDRMVELPNGCVCCTIGTQFALAVQEILETVQPHLIVIETSGVAEPGPLLSELALIGVKTDSVITVVDTENIERFCRESTIAVRQIEDADFLVLNKTDLLHPRQLGRVEKRMQALNSRARLFPTSYGVVDADLLFATGVSSYWDRARHPRDGRNGRRSHDEFTAFSVQATGILNRERFEKFLRTLPSNVYRAKGIVKFFDEGWSSIFNVTGGRSRVDWLAPADGNVFPCRGIMIGKELLPIQSRITREFEGCFELQEECAAK